MRISAILGIFGILAIMFLLSGCSFKYFDPQWYKFLSSKQEAKRYIYDKKLYEAFVLNIHDNEEYLTTDKLMPNGYKLLLDGEVEILGKRLKKIMRKFYYIDSHNKECLISKLIAFEYISYGLWLQGDEGRGFRLKGGDKSVFLWNEDNVFYYDKETDAFIKKDSNDK